MNLQFCVAVDLRPALPKNQNQGGTIADCTTVGYKIVAIMRTMTINWFAKVE